MRSRQIQKLTRKKLSEICNIFSGGTPSTKNEEYWNGDIHWLSSGETRNSFIADTERKITLSGIKNSSTRLAKKGDVVIASAGQGHTRGQTSFCLIDTYVNQSVVVLRANKKIVYPKFLFYNLKSRYNELRRFSDAHSSRGSLPKNVLLTLDVILPPLSQQGKIGKILFDLDTKIENLQNQNKVLEQIAQAVFKSWFVDYEFPDEKGRPYRSSGGKMTYDEELGEIPKGWKVVNMSELIKINPSRNLKKNSLAPYLGMTDIPIYSSRISRFYLRVFTSGMKFMNGDTLVARITPSLENGKTAFVDFLQNNEVGWGSTEYIVLRPRNPLPPEYGYCFARTDEFRAHAIANMTGTSGRQRVPENCFDDYKDVTPPIDLAETFGKISKKLFLKIRENGEMCDVLTTLRDSLLPKLMSGKIRI